MIATGLGSAPIVTMVTCSISGNRAATGGGGIYNDGAQLELSTRTALLNNSAPGGGSISFLAGGIFYRLPAPAGRWLPSGECVIFRESCGVWGDCSDPGDVGHADCVKCDEAAFRAACGVNATAAGSASGCSPTTADTVGGCCPDATFVQPCDWEADPTLLGQQIYTLQQDQPVDDDSSNPSPLLLRDPRP